MNTSADEDILRFCEPVLCSDDSNASSSSSSSSSNSARIIKRGKKLRIAVLLSGGMRDSSVALSLFRAAGHECCVLLTDLVSGRLSEFLGPVSVGGRCNGREESVRTIAGTVTDGAFYGRLLEFGGETVRGGDSERENAKSGYFV